jgi:hypothetical protein
MMDDIRNHDAMPSTEECAWMEDGIVALARTFALAALALAIVLGAGMLVDDADASTGAAVFGPR